MMSFVNDGNHYLLGKHIMIKTIRKRYVREGMSDGTVFHFYQYEKVNTDYPNQIPEIDHTEMIRTTTMRRIPNFRFKLPNHKQKDIWRDPAIKILADKYKSAIGTDNTNFWYRYYTKRWFKLIKGVLSSDKQQ